MSKSKNRSHRAAAAYVIAILCEDAGKDMDFEIIVYNEPLVQISFVRYNVRICMSNRASLALLFAIREAKIIHNHPRFKRR